MTFFTPGLSEVGGVSPLWSSPEPGSRVPCSVFVSCVTCVRSCARCASDPVYLALAPDPCPIAALAAPAADSGADGSALGEGT